MNLLHNIDDVRAEIMRLESAPIFDAVAWAKVLADLETQCRVSALADAKRRMVTAKENQSPFVETLPIKDYQVMMLLGHRPVSAETDNTAFYAGIITALAIVDLHGEDTIYDEIVNTCDAVELWKHAVANDEIEFSGLARHGYSLVTITNEMEGVK